MQDADGIPVRRAQERLRNTPAKGELSRFLRGTHRQRTLESIRRATG